MTLYSIKHHIKTSTDSTLFADDLATSCSSENIKNIEKIFTLYMEKLENWLIKWRLCINPSKCKLILISKCKKEMINVIERGRTNFKK